MSPLNGIWYLGEGYPLPAKYLHPTSTGPVADLENPWGVCANLGGGVFCQQVQILPKLGKKMHGVWKNLGPQGGGGCSCQRSDLDSGRKLASAGNFGGCSVKTGTDWQTWRSESYWNALKILGGVYQRSDYGLWDRIALFTFPVKFWGLMCGVL